MNSSLSNSISPGCISRCVVRVHQNALTMIRQLNLMCLQVPPKWLRTQYPVWGQWPWLREKIQAAFKLIVCLPSLDFSGCISRFVVRVHQNTLKVVRRLNLVCLQMSSKWLRALGAPWQRRGAQWCKAIFCVCLEVFGQFESGFSAFKPLLSGGWSGKAPDCNG